jgi:hypothetical protein
MSTVRAIENAYIKTAKRKWDRVYWALDLHDTCIKATYEANKPHTYEWINPYVKSALKRLQAHPETCLILWSSVHEAEKVHYLNFFANEGIHVSGFNHNPFETGSESCCVDEKFYFSILVDDKAGFDQSEWLHIPDFVDYIRQEYPPVVKAAKKTIPDAELDATTLA